MRRAVASLGALLALVCASKAVACNGDLFIEDLIRSGDTFRAVTIAKETEFRLRGSDEGFTCARRLLATFLVHAEYQSADAWLDRMLVHYPQVGGFGSAARLRAEMALAFGNPSEAKRRLATAGGDATADPLWAFASAEVAPLQPPVVSCAAPECLSLRALYGDADLSTKSPGLAAVLGVVPGLGQLYAGRPLGALGSFLLNSLLMGGTAYAIHRGEYALALLSGAGALALYGGNFYAGYEAARRTNELRAQQIRARLRDIPRQSELRRLAASPL